MNPAQSYMMDREIWWSLHALKLELTISLGNSRELFHIIRYYDEEATWDGSMDLSDGSMGGRAENNFDNI